MRAVVIVVIIVAVTAGVLKHRNRAQSDASAEKPIVAQQQATAPREPSEHNWPKRALDRAADVKRPVAEQRKEDGTR